MIVFSVESRAQGAFGPTANERFELFDREPIVARALQSIEDGRAEHGHIPGRRKEPSMTA